MIANDYSPKAQENTIGNAKKQDRPEEVCPED